MYNDLGECHGPRDTREWTAGSIYLSSFRTLLWYGFFCLGLVAFFCCYWCPLLSIPYLICRLNLKTNIYIQVNWQYKKINALDLYVICSCLGYMFICLYMHIGSNHPTNDPKPAQTIRMNRCPFRGQEALKPKGKFLTLLVIRLAWIWIRTPNIEKCFDYVMGISQNCPGSLT